MSILNGTRTTAGEYPAVVVVTVDTNLCTGTLVAPSWVITAGHCIDPASLNLASQDAVTASTRVHFDTLDVFTQPGRVVTASLTVKDPQFDKGRLGSHDLGLIKLSTPVTDIAPTPINLAAFKAPVGIAATVVGYGSTAQPGMQGTIGVEFEVKDRASVSCGGFQVGTDANLLCFSQANGTGTCQGDSGGPELAIIDGKQTVAGVTSFGDPQCAEYSAATRIDIEQPFLASVAPELAGCRGDSECGANRACFLHTCIAQPFSPSGLGTVCATPTDCESSQCVESSQDGMRCSFMCSVADEASCPEGFECLRANGDIGACWPSSGGGCCDAGGGGPGTAVLGLVVGLALRRRRPLRRRDR